MRESAVRSISSCRWSINSFALQAPHYFVDKNKVVKFFYTRVRDVVVGTFPQHITFVEEHDLFAYAKQGVHIVRYYNGSNAVFVGDLKN